MIKLDFAFDDVFNGQFSDLHTVSDFKLKALVAQEFKFCKLFRFYKLAIEEFCRGQQGIRTSVEIQLWTIDICHF